MKRHLMKGSIRAGVTYRGMVTMIRMECMAHCGRTLHVKAFRKGPMCSVCALVKLRRAQLEAAGG